MYLYFLLIRIAALFGHQKARLLVAGQKQSVQRFHQPVWIHAASVGEFEQARPLIERLRRERPEQKIVVTFFSPSGYEVRKNFDRVDQVLYLPFATRRNAKRFLDTLQPCMAIFVKYEFWPAYLRELKRRAIPTYSICAIFRPGQLFFRPWGKLHLSLLNCFTRIYVQDTASETLLRTHDIKHVTVAGDTRFDRMAQIVETQKAKAETAADPRLELVRTFVQGAERVIVAGSTWPKDEALLAQYIDQANANGLLTNVKLILAPHEIDETHLHYIFNLLQGRMLRLTRANTVNIAHTQVLVVDTIGLLAQIYQFGHVAYIGGGFGVGIHNTIEAAVWGKPVLFGPNYLHFREAKGLIEAGAARSIKNYRQLEDALETALANHTEIGTKAAAYVQSELGATEKIYKDIFNS